ncbi:MAG: LVIVD repeat-containing protein, partial [Streptomycetales bacterium]
HPEECSKTEPLPDEEDHEAICFTEEEIAAMDDSGAELAVDEISKSDNIKLLANLPKQDEFAPEAAFNSDLAFQGDFAFDGNYNGVAIFDVSKPHKPRQVGQLLCPGQQNDVTVNGDLLVLSTDQSRSNATCDSVAQSSTIKESWEGVKVFDISDPTSPEFVTSVETDCGSHTHTAVPDPENDRLLVYVQSFSPALDRPDCQPPHDKIAVVEVREDAPQDAHIVSEPVLFPDGGFPGIPGRTSSTSGCHDITVYPEKGLAAGACMGEGVLIDITDPVNPEVIDSVTDPNFAFWHSATFNNDATSVVFTDELGGGGQPTCNPTVGPERGADAVFRIVDTAQGKQLEFGSYFKIPRVNTNNENCVAHNGSLIPVPGRDIMVQAWYQGGISVWEFTDPENPREIAFFERGPLSDERRIIGGSWSAYWYNGAIYSSDIQKGLDVLKVTDPAVAPAMAHSEDLLNVQTQRSFTG